jgi:SAM-dependent methyltransferase
METAFWQSRYQEHRTPWDLGTVAPPFVDLLAKPPFPMVPGYMAVLGAGYGHDAAFFGQHGFQVSGFDIVPEAVQAATKRYGQWARFVHADLFSLAPEYNGQFDYVLEHTCFCAIPPDRRPEYLAVVKRLLKPGGYFIGLIWAMVDREDGPPYPSTEAEIRTLFDVAFQQHLCVVPSHSVPLRQGQELLCLFQLRG